jgi:Domain of unknown function (DUF4249)
MMRLREIRFLIVLPALIEMAGCKKPYAPPIIASNVNYLVVEGVINSGQDSTIIKLSRTVNLSGVTSSKPELSAVIAVESNQNNSYPLQEIGDGKYGSAGLNLNNTGKYRLRIKTAKGKEYVSDLEPAKADPPIDSVGFIAQENGLQIYVNTHDANNNTRYYRWEYQEAWAFHAKYHSQYITDGKELVLRTPDQETYFCFGSNASTSIVLGSSAKLIKDVIYQNPITQIASASIKIETKYSILVKQYALTSDEFIFWQNLKKNTEQLGGIFDPQPSNLNGNIHSTTDPTEPVIGYIGVTNVQQKRVFISKEQLPLTWAVAYPADCEAQTNLFCWIPLYEIDCVNQVEANLVPLGSSQLILAEIYDSTGAIIGYSSSAQECTDCTLTGVKKQPDFWK